MDEIDAALDFKNVSIVANYIKVRMVLFTWLFELFWKNVNGSGHETVAILLPGFAINW